MSSFDFQEREEVTRGARALVLLPVHREINSRDINARLEEACGLALAIGLTLIDRQAVPIRSARPAMLFGPGQVERIAEQIERDQIDLVIVDGRLTPVQQRNLEAALHAKVIDRTALILEIFGERAATAEGRLQVELAHLDYQASRLVRSWTHLERQRGGFGFLGGPGETQIEADRRLIRDRMAKLRRQLESVRKTRALHRDRRKRAPWPVVSLVGYTNAGKSTLFNRLTGAGVLSADMLFATLDPTMRSVDLAGVGKIILSDTVGFVSDLPTQLVAAFRATLEEVMSADIIVHVRDVSHGDSEAQRADVLNVLDELGLTPEADGGPIIIEALNKIDLLDDTARAAVMDRIADDPAKVALSAATGEGVPKLLDILSKQMLGPASDLTLDINAADGRRLAWLHDHGIILDQQIMADHLRIEVRLSRADLARYQQLDDQ